MRDDFQDPNTAATDQKDSDGFSAEIVVSLGASLVYGSIAGVATFVNADTLLGGLGRGLAAYSLVGSIGLLITCLQIAALKSIAPGLRPPVPARLISEAA